MMESLNCFFFLKEFSSLASYKWGGFHHLLFLNAGGFSFSYFARFVQGSIPDIWRDFISCFLYIERMFFICFLILFWSVWSCSSHTSTFLGSSFSFLIFCLDINFRKWFSFHHKVHQLLYDWRGSSYKQANYLYRIESHLGVVCLRV